MARRKQKQKQKRKRSTWKHGSSRSKSKSMPRTSTINPEVGGRKYPRHRKLEFFFFVLFLAGAIYLGLRNNGVGDGIVQDNEDHNYTTAAESASDKAMRRWGYVMKGVDAVITGVVLGILLGGILQVLGYPVVQTVLGVYDNVRVRLGLETREEMRLNRIGQEKADELDAITTRAEFWKFFDSPNWELAFTRTDREFHLPNMDAVEKVFIPGGIIHKRTMGTMPDALKYIDEGRVKI